MAEHEQALKDHLAKLARHREVSAELKDLRLQAKVANAVYQKTEDDLTALQVRRCRAHALTLCVRPIHFPRRALTLVPFAPPALRRAERPLRRCCGSSTRTGRTSAARGTRASS